MDDYDQYFEIESPILPPRPRLSPTKLTGTTGKPVEPNPIAISRALNRLYDISEGKRDYAAVLEFNRKIGIVRLGERLTSATFTVFWEHDGVQKTETYHGSPGRTRAIQHLLQLLKRKR